MLGNSVFVTRHLEGNENVACLSAVRGPDSTNTGVKGGNPKVSRCVNEIRLRTTTETRFSQEPQRALYQPNN
uniref:Uncharacterized protein n=1 Tax=Vespula pensylvanica TaxID=30213 RepID=A0A834U9E6_VESPE|nr:hypothetical protein H0235_008751 [Vespula pensylvanica]